MSSSQTMTLGRELKRRREASGLTLRQISDETRINLRFLQAIENDDFRTLPGGIFNRSFVRKLAQYVGMDEQEALKLYASQFGQLPDEDSGEIQQPVGQVFAADMERRSAAPIIGVIVTMVVLAGLVYGGWKAYPALRAQFASPKPPANSAPVDKRPANANQPVSTPAAPPTSGQSASSSTPLLAGDQLKVQIKVTQNICWMRLKVDEDKPEVLILKTGENRDVSPKDKLVLSLGESKNVEVLINGQAAHFDKSKVTNAVISRDTWQQFVGK